MGRQKKRLGSTFLGTQGRLLVLGEVLRFHVADSLFDDHRIDADGLQAIGRMGGPAYSRTKDRFDLERPKL